MKTLTDTDYIHTLIAEGEHQQQDFKFEISDARKIAKTLSAFANTDGGRLLIGVKDNGRIAGVRSEEEKYMIEDKKIGHRNKPNRMSDAEMMVILILFHSGGFRCFKHYYKEYERRHVFI